MAWTDIAFGLDYIWYKGHLLATRAPNSCRPELKPDHPLPVVSFSLFPTLYHSLSSSPFPSFISCCLKVILKACWSLSKVKGDNITCLSLCFLSQLWFLSILFQSILQPGLFMSMLLHPLPILVEEVEWPLCLVQGDLVYCRVNGFPFQCVCSVRCHWDQSRVGCRVDGDIEVWWGVFSNSSHNVMTGAVIFTLLRHKPRRFSSSGPGMRYDFFKGKLATLVMPNAGWPGAERWQHMVNETGSCGMCSHLLLQLGGWLAANQADC